MNTSSRRAFVISGVAGAGVALVGCARKGGESSSAGVDEKGQANAQTPDEDVSPPEDLMREHGALNRLLLVYDEVSRRIAAGDPIPVSPLEAAAGIIRKFVEGYHEKLEEEELFPRFRKAGKLVDLTDVLKAQHDAGRRLTDAVLAEARPDGDGPALRRTLGLFVRMYRPHEAREDTVLFPELHHMLSEKEMKDLGEKFEAREHQLFGDAGFEGVVKQIAQIEKTLGIYDLASFTPPA